MDVALVSEYLRNVGYDIPKPDRHIRRILGSKMLACSEHEDVPVYEVFDIVAGLAEASGRKQAEVDYILWSYCADGFGGICKKENPKCELCTVQQYCVSVQAAATCLL